MKLIRRLVLVTLKHNIFFKSEHIPGKLNITADYLSRFKFQDAFRSAPYLNTTPTILPVHRLDI